MSISDNEEESRLEYSKSWIKGCLYSYLKGQGSVNKVKGEIKRAKTYGVSKQIFQIIIESLPFDKKSERFQHILEILKEDCDY